MYATAKTHIVHVFTLTFTAPFRSFAFFSFFFFFFLKLPFVFLPPTPYTFNPLLRNS